MSDLRSACIEAMARAYWESYNEGIERPFRWEEAHEGQRKLNRLGVSRSLDALLGVLEEHADEWANATDSGGYSWFVKPRDASRLLAVLREDT